ncbi:MAG: hypothetical protein ACC707_12190 [Thiohalomonadales bacterium]
MLRIWRQTIGVFVFIFIISVDLNAADAPQQVIDSHDTAVEQARGGDYRGALLALDALIKQNPDFYPAKRDYVIIATWMEDCDVALQSFNSIRANSPLEGYLVEPVAECMREKRQLDEALVLLESAVVKNPEDEDAQRALKDLKEYMKFESRSSIYARIGYNESDQGNTDKQAEFKYSHEISNTVRIYYRHLILQADDKNLSTGDVSRASIGLSTWFAEKYMLDAAVFTDVANSDGDGAQAYLNYYPNSLWEIGVGYSSAAEDIALRARAVGTKATSASIGTGYHSKDYVWEWSANYNQHDFSDTNKRKALGTDLAYAFRMKDNNEQRIILGWYSSQNSPAGLDVPYYAPVKDSSITISFRNDHVYDTDWERIVDHLSLYVGFYSQRAVKFDTKSEFSYPTKEFAGVAYDLDWELNRRQSLSFSVGYGSAVYDGVAERQTRASVSYNHRL